MRERIIDRVCSGSLFQSQMAIGDITRDFNEVESHILCNTYNLMAEELG